MLTALAVLAIAYRYYSAFLAAKVLCLDDARRTPAHELNDGHNYHPTDRWVLFGHHFAAITGAGPLIGLWDMQGGVAGRGDEKVVPSMWYSVEHQVTTRVDEWDGQPVRMAQEEDMIISADGKVRWAHKRQDRLHIVK